MLEKTLESLLDRQEIKPVRPKGNQSWIFIGRTDAEAETPVLWPSDMKSWLIGKDPDAGKDWKWEEKGTTKDEVVGWHCWLNGHEFQWTPGVGNTQGGLACCNPWGRKESNMTEQLNWPELNWAPGRGLAKQAPGLTTFQFLHSKINSMNIKPGLQFGHRLMISVCFCPGIISGNPELQSLKSHPRSRHTAWDPFQMGLQMCCNRTFQRWASLNVGQNPIWWCILCCFYFSFVLFFIIIIIF